MKMLFTLKENKDGSPGLYKFSNNGFIVIEVRDGEIANVKSKRLQSTLVRDKLARKATLKDATKVTEAEASEEVNDDDEIKAEDLSQLNPVDTDDDEDDADDDDENNDPQAPDNLTAIHKIGEALEQELYAAGITTYKDLADALADDNKRAFIIGLKGITKKDIPKIEDQLVTLMESE